MSLENNIEHTKSNIKALNENYARESKKLNILDQLSLCDTDLKLQILEILVDELKVQK